MENETTTQPQGTQTSEGESGTTSQEAPTFTQEQVAAREAKARSDALAEVGRLRKALDAASKAGQGAIERLRQREEEDLRREEEAVRDDPEKMSALQMKRKAMETLKRAEEVTSRLETEKTEITTQREQLRHEYAERYAEKYNVSPDILLEYGGNTRESIEKLAKTFGEKSKTSGETTSSETQIIRQTKAPDSGKTKGGVTSGREPTLEEVSSASTQEFAAKVKSGEWIVRGGGWTP